MNKAAFLAAIPLALGLSACGEPIDGSDTADLGNDTTTAAGTTSDAPGMNPAQDGMLDTDAETVREAEAQDAAAETATPAPQN